MSTASEGASRGGQTTHLGTLRFASVACTLIRLRGIRRTGRLAAVALRSASGYHGIWLPHYSGNFAFSQTTFRLRKVTEGVSYRILNASVVIPTSTLQFNDCTFETDSSLDAGDLVYGLVVGGGPDQRMRVNVQGGVFDSTAAPLDYAVYAQGGLILAIQGTLFRGDSSTTAVYLGGSGSPYVNEVLLDGLRVDHDVSCELGGGNAQHFVTHRNVIVPANQACSNYAAWVLTGERVLVGTLAPSGSCKPSDIYRLEPIPASGIVQWQCAADSTWHAVASLQ